MKEEAWEQKKKKLKQEDAHSKSVIFHDNESR